MTHEEGFYNCRIVAQRFGESQKKSTPYFQLSVIPVEKINTATQEKTPLAGDQQRESEPMYITPDTMNPTDKSPDPVFPSKMRAIVGSDDWDFDRLGDPMHPKYINLVGRTVTMLNKPEADKKDPTKFYDRFDVFSQTPRTPPKSDPNVAKKLQTLYGGNMARKPAPVSVTQPGASPAPTQAPVASVAVTATSPDALPF